MHTFPAMQDARANMQTSRMPTLPIAVGGIPPAGSHWYSGALTDRPSRGAELRALGRPRRERQPLHEPRNRDSAFEGTNAHEYRAPGSPRNPYRKVEMFYINANVRGPREVRLIARQELAARQQEPLTIAATFPLDQQQLTPALSNATLAALTPRGALARGSQPQKLVAVRLGDDWSTGLKKDGEQVKWNGSSSNKKGGGSTFVPCHAAISPLPVNGRNKKSHKVGKAGPATTCDKTGITLASPVDSKASRKSKGMQKATKSVSSAWPREAASPGAWAMFVKGVKDRARGNMSYEEHADKFFGDSGKGMQKPDRLNIREPAEPLVRLPQQWLHTGLTHISLVACRLNSLPSSFGDYSFNVTNLMLEHNVLSGLPDSFCKMVRLKYLGLTANQFEEFPDVIGKCTALQVLSMQNNKLPKIKACIGYCRDLRKLYLKNNPLTKLALSIGALKSLDGVSYDNDESMLIPPHEVGTHGHSAVISWLKIFFHNIVVNFRSELRKNFYTARAAFAHFDQDRSGEMDKAEVAAALQHLNIDIKYFEYVWLTLDMDNSGTVEYWEFVSNFTDNMNERLIEPNEALKPVLPDDVIRRTSDLLMANPWSAVKNSSEHFTVANSF